MTKCLCVPIAISPCHPFHRTRLSKHRQPGAPVRHAVYQNRLLFVSNEDSWTAIDFLSTMTKPIQFPRATAYAVLSWMRLLVLTAKKRPTSWGFAALSQK